MSVDDVWGVETRHMNQSELDTEPGSATKDKKSMMTKKKGAKKQISTVRKQLLSTCVSETFHITIQP